MKKASIETLVHRLMDRGHEQVPVIAGKITDTHGQETEDFAELVGKINQAKQTYEQNADPEPEPEPEPESEADTSTDPEPDADTEPSSEPEPKPGKNDDDELTQDDLLDIELMENDEPVDAAGEEDAKPMAAEADTSESTGAADATGSSSDGGAAAASGGGGTTTSDDGDTEPDVEELFPSDDPLGIDS